jgi:hypothetical protein
VKTQFINRTRFPFLADGLLAVDMSRYDDVSINGELNSIGSSIPGMEKPSLCRSIQTDGLHQASYSFVIGRLFLKTKDVGE